MEFNKGSIVLHLGKSTSMHEYRLGVGEKQLCGERPGNAARQQAHHEREICSCGQEGQQSLGMH